MQLVHAPHQCKIGGRHRTRLVVKTAATDVQHGRLPREREIMIAVNHRLALSNPALSSALSKKSFSSVSSPIFACSALMSTSGVDGLALELVANTSAAPSSSRSFQVDIWLGWMSNCSASCTSVRSPLIAAIATFALKADVWFRRGLLLMLSPDSRAKSCPLSGRSSTYRPVQILEAGSGRPRCPLRSNCYRIKGLPRIGFLATETTQWSSVAASNSRSRAARSSGSFPTRPCTALKVRAASALLPTLFPSPTGSRLSPSSSQGAIHDMAQTGRSNVRYVDPQRRYTVVLGPSWNAPFGASPHDDPAGTH